MGEWGPPERKENIYAEKCHDKTHYFCLLTKNIFKEKRKRVSKMVQCVKELAAKTDVPSLILEIHTVEGEN